MKRQETRTAVLLVTLLSASCQPPRLPPEVVSMDALQRLVPAVEEYQLAGGRFPLSADSLCAVPIEACTKYRASWTTKDSWGIEFAIAAPTGGLDYEVRSAGPDRAPGTADDLILRSSHQRARVRDLAGCYDVEGWEAAWGVVRVRLDSIRGYSGAYGLHVLESRLPTPSPEWYPWGADTVMVRFIGVSGADVTLRQRGDVLEGRSESSNDISPFVRSRAAFGRRVPC